MRLTSNMVAVGSAAIVLGAVFWIVSARRTSAETAITSSQGTRYLLESASDGSMFKIDTWSGETWSLTPSNVDRVPKQWIRIPDHEAAGRDGGFRRERTQ